MFYDFFPYIFYLHLVFAQWPQRCDSSEAPVLHLQLKDVRGQLGQTVVGEVDLLQVSSPEYRDGIWKILDFIAGRFALPLH